MIYIIANKLSGSGKGAVYLEKAENLLKSRGLEYTVLVSEYRKHVIELTKQACADINCRRIIAIGGDGTFSEILNGLDLSVPVAFVPAGTGNDFVEGADLQTDPDKALQTAVDGKVMLYDFLRLNDKRCLNIAGTGFDVYVLLAEEKIRKKFPGRFSYTLALLKTLLKLRFTQIKLRIDDGEERDMSLFLIAAANGKLFGGGLPICVSADCKDGYIDVVLIKELPRRIVPRILTKFLKGRLFEETEYVEVHRCKKVSFDATPALPVNIDGELTEGMLPVEIEIVNRRLQIIK